MAFYYALNIHTKRQVHQSWYLDKKLALMDGILSLPAAGTLPEKHRFETHMTLETADHEIRPCRKEHITYAKLSEIINKLFKPSA